jgi:hypothetical protein
MRLDTFSFMPSLQRGHCWLIWRNPYPQPFVSWCSGGYSSNVESALGNVLLRITAPVALAVSALAYTLPITSDNIHRRLLQEEELRTPKLAQVHKDALRSIQGMFQRVQATTSSIRQTSASWLQTGKQSATAKLGLQEQEALPGTDWSTFAHRACICLLASVACLREALGAWTNPALLWMRSNEEWALDSIVLSSSSPPTCETAKLSTIRQSAWRVACHLIAMSLVSITDISVQNNPARFVDAFVFKITFECIAEMSDGQHSAVQASQPRVWRALAARYRMEAHLRGFGGKHQPRSRAGLLHGRPCSGGRQQLRIWGQSDEAHQAPSINNQGQAAAPTNGVIPASDLLGLTVVLLTASYREQEFVRVGYYVHTEYDSEDLKALDLQPDPPIVERLVRNVAVDKPRVTRFNIKWN